MPPKRRKFESTFPAARIKKIMQLDDDVGRVASSVPILISRAVEIFLHALLTRASIYAASRSAKTLTVGHLKHCIEGEKQWDFLKDLTAKVPDVNPKEESEEGSRRGRKRKNSGSKPPAASKRKAKRSDGVQQHTETDDSDLDENGDSEASSPGSSHSHASRTKSQSKEPSPLALLQQRLAPPKGELSIPQSAPDKPSPLLAYTSSLAQKSSNTSLAKNLGSLASLGTARRGSSDEDYDA